MKKILYCILALTLVLTIFPATALATELENEATVVRQETIFQADGSVLEIRVVESPSGTPYYKDGSITYTHSSSSGATLWSATLNARFYYDGTTCYCVAASLSTQFNDSSFYEVSRSVTKLGATATANFTIGHRVLGITVSKTPYTLTLTCDKYGNLS